MINIGILAEKYHMLPSQVLNQATSYDLMITDVMTTWKNYRDNPQDMENYRTEDLQDLLKAVRQ